MRPRRRARLREDPRGPRPRQTRRWSGNGAGSARWAWDASFRSASHCERSDAIQGYCTAAPGLLPAFAGTAGLLAMTSRLQLTLEFVEEAPIGVLGDELLWARLDHARFVHPQRVEAERVLWVVVAPKIVSDLF